MPTVTDAANQSTALTALISSLTTAKQTTVRPQIKAAALLLQSTLLTLSNVAAESAATTAASSFDALITWTASGDGNLRNKVTIAATSAQPIYVLLNQITGWASFLGTLDWAITPEVPAAKLALCLASYRSITGT